jgi:two-component system sensor histidine kinase EvgS
MLAHYGVRVALCVALRRGDTIVGIHAAGYRRAREFSPAQERLARSIAQLASMALTNATLFEELERAGRLKSEFVSTMSHELRTPLNVILGYTDMLTDHVRSDEQRGLLARVRQSSVELLEMIDATLSLNRLAAGTDVPRIEAMSLAGLWEDLRAEFDALPRPAAVGLRWEPAGETVLQTDRRRLKIVVKNLVGNALKFTSTGEIVVGCQATPTGAVISVRDTGIGIPPEHVPHIFEMFRQVDSSDTRSYSGAGLGLYIVRQLVDQLGGTIAVDTAPGRGSTFRVTLPDGSRPTVATAAA